MAKTDAKIKKVEEVKEVVVRKTRKEGVEEAREVGAVLTFRDRFEAFNHYGVGSLEQLAEKLGKEFHGQSFEELVNG